jgi:AraC-like DNA-binding protein
LSTTYLILFATNLTFIVTHLYGWLLKWFYRPKAYGEHFHELFPAQRIVGITYFMQIFELPYLLQIGDPDALLYVNAYSLLLLSIQLLVMSEIYFFPKQKHKRQYPMLYLPAVLVMLPMFLQAVKLISLPEGWRTWAMVAVSILFAFYFGFNIHMLTRIERAVRRANEEQYADSDDFPVSFANIIKWLPPFVLLLLAVNFYADDPWVKFGHDLFFIVANVWFCILTLNPWREVNSDIEIPNSELEVQDSESEKEEKDVEEEYEDDSPGLSERTAESPHLLSDAKYDELARRLEKLLTDDHIFTEPHITIDILIQRLGTNTKYLSELIRRSGYQSFYDMISQHRVRYAIALIHQHPDERLADISDQCGFSSQASMTKAFKAQGKETPSRYRNAE